MNARSTRCARETHEIQHFVVVAAAQDHAVQPDAPKPGALRRGDAGRHVAQAARARQRAETVLAQAVQADVDASEARRLQRRGELREARPVGRQGEFVEPGQARDALDERRQAGAHERLAAREPDPAHAERDARPRESGERVERQHVRARWESHVLRHAVHATEVAPVRHRQTHIRDSAAEAIDERAGAVDARGAGSPPARGSPRRAPGSERGGITRLTRRCGPTGRACPARRPTPRDREAPVSCR